MIPDKIKEARNILFQLRDNFIVFEANLEVIKTFLERHEQNPNDINLFILNETFKDLELDCLDYKNAIEKTYEILKSE